MEVRIVSDLPVISQPKRRYVTLKQANVNDVVRDLYPTSSHVSDILDGMISRLWDSA